jgi:hypothetical protein
MCVRADFFDIHSEYSLGIGDGLVSRWRREGQDGKDE